MMEEKNPLKRNSKVEVSGQPEAMSEKNSREVLQSDSETDLQTSVKMHHGIILIPSPSDDPHDPLVTIVPKACELKLN